LLAVVLVAVVPRVQRLAMLLVAVVLVVIVALLQVKHLAVAVLPRVNFILATLELTLQT
jgi:hypothetical protein